MTEENITQYEFRPGSGNKVERHLQSALLAVISLLLTGTLWVLTEVMESLDMVKERQSTQGATISALVENQNHVGRRLDMLATDRYTATAASADKLEIRQDLASLAGTLADHSERIRRLENEWARFEGERSGSSSSN